MSETPLPKIPATSARTVQAYIDETPVWSDGTPVPAPPLTRMQWRIWTLAAAGKFFEGLVVFMTGVAMPLVAAEFHCTPAQHGLLGAASLAGILAGAAGLGSLSDVFGRKTMFVTEMIIFMVFLVMVCISPSYEFLVFSLFGIGVALGCDYPTAHIIISESIPSSIRGRFVLAAFGFQALGALIGTAVGYVVLQNIPHVGAWRWMYATALIPAIYVTLDRFRITESAQWLFSRGRIAEAEIQALELLSRKPPYPRSLKFETSDSSSRQKASYWMLFNKENRRATILASLPWFLQDLGTYGIGIFTPTILAASFGHKTSHVRNLADLISNDELAAKGAALIDLLLIVGIVIAALLADRIGRIKLQIIGFIGCAAGLLLASTSSNFAGNGRIAAIFGGFMLFNFMTNIGPNAQTYLLAGEVFPTRLRGKGAGFAAAFAKLGAVVTAFLFPILLTDIGTQNLLYILVGTSLLGALITWWFRIETMGLCLEKIGTK